MIIKRREYLDQIIPYIDKPTIKVLNGMLYSGKTTLLKQTIEVLKEKGINEENIIYINFESLKNVDLDNVDVIEEYIFEKTRKLEGKIYIFLDEISTIKNWEYLAKTYYDYGTYDIYLAGSNRKILSEVFKDYVNHDYISINVFPFSFKEYMEYYKIKDHLEKYYYEFVEYGGVPQLFTNKNKDREKLIHDTLDTMFYNTFKYTRFDSGREIFKILDNIMHRLGEGITTTEIAIQKLGSQSKRSTINRIIKLLTDNYMIHGVTRERLLDGNSRKIRISYYIPDQGFRTGFIDSNMDDLEKITKNIVYNELLKRGYEITVGEIDDLVIDFVCRKDNETIYVQVGLKPDGEEIEQDCFPFTFINDDNPKYYITMRDMLDQGDVRSLNLFEFLMGKTELN